MWVEHPNPVFLLQDSRCKSKINVREHAPHVTEVGGGKVGTLTRKIFVARLSV